MCVRNAPSPCESRPGPSGAAWGACWAGWAGSLSGRSRVCPTHGIMSVPSNAGGWDALGLGCGAVRMKGEWQAVIKVGTELPAAPLASRLGAEEPDR